MLRAVTKSRTRLGLTLLIFALVAGLALEVYRGAVFYRDVSAGADTLRSLRDRLNAGQLDRDQASLAADQVLLLDAHARLDRARRFAESDPLLAVATRLPGLGKQARGVQALTRAAAESAEAGLDAVELALAFARYEPAPGQTSVEGAMSFLESQAQPLAGLRASLDRLHATRGTVPGGLAGPLQAGVRELDEALAKLTVLVEGYERAQAFLPELLGYNGVRRYVLLPQNNAELFPSGGLISSYGILTVEDGQIRQVDLEYFGTLYDRWQAATGDYVEPPEALKHYLKKDFSWGLGEAGWYPDFATTAALAEDFVAKGGAPATDGTIAIDMTFMRELLAVLGPVDVPEYGVTVAAESFEAVTLQYTRDEYYIPGQPRKAFLSYLAREVMQRLLAAPKEGWLDVLTLLDRMGRERHLQMRFDDERLAALTADYGFDGALEAGTTDYLLIADTSVSGTKLNLILEPSAQVWVTLTPFGAAMNRLDYAVTNPFPRWQRGRDADLVRALMRDGVYGSYLRIYVPAQSQLSDVRLNDVAAGAEQNDFEFGRKVFGRFFRVLPGQTQHVSFAYTTRGAVVRDGSDCVYSLYLQKQPGTDALPFTVEVTLPPGATHVSSSLDGEPQKDTAFDVALREDRLIEVRFQMP